MSPYQSLVDRARLLPGKLLVKHRPLSRMVGAFALLDERGGDPALLLDAWDREIAKLERGAAAMRGRR